MSTAKTQTSAPGRSDLRWLWISLMVFSVAALAANAFLRKDGMAHRYVEVIQFERVEATTVVESGANATGAETAQAEWVDPTDARLANGTLRLVDGVAPIKWELHKDVASTTEANETIARRAAGDKSAPVVELSMWNSLGVWAAALLTLGIFSFLYRDNPYYKVSESLLIGSSAAYWMINGFWTTIVPNLFGKLAPDVVRVYAIPSLPVSEHPGLDAGLAFVPLILGFMLIWRLAPKGGWIAVWPLAFIIGTTAGLKLVSSIESDLMAQAVATMKPMVVFAAPSTSAVASSAVSAVNFWATVGSLVGVVGVLSVLTYFFFSVEHKGAVGKAARLGVWFLMITFGSAFGLTVMGRITLLAQRLEFLFNSWLNIN